MGRTCGEPGEIKKNTHPKIFTALFREQADAEAHTRWRIMSGTRREPFNSTPNGGQFDFVWLSARTPHAGPQRVWRA